MQSVKNDCNIETVSCSRLVNCRNLMCFHVKNKCFQSYQLHLIMFRRERGAEPLAEMLSLGSELLFLISIQISENLGV